MNANIKIKKTTKTRLEKLGKLSTGKHKRLNFELAAEILSLFSSFKVKIISKIEDNANLLVSDAVPSDPDLVYDLHAGANLISYPSDISMPIGEGISNEFYNYRHYLKLKIQTSHHNLFQ